MPKVRASYIWFLLLGIFGGQMGLVTPTAISLAIRLSQLAPGHEEYLGYIAGVGAAVSMVAGPLFGALSDRARTRLGRRRPFILYGMTTGVAALFTMALAPNVVVLGLGWVLVQLTWAIALSMFTASQADRVPPSQRGKLSGLTGFLSMLAPTMGAVVAGSLAFNSLLLFMVPAAVGVLGMILFIVFVPEPDGRLLPPPGPLSLKSLVSKYVFNPRLHPDFAWNWLGRFVFISGMWLGTTFMAFFLASRLGVRVEQAATTAAALSAVGILASMAGAVGGGFLSDKLRRRLPLALIAACLYAAGALLMALGPDFTSIAAGMMLCNLGIGAFSSVDQAIAIDLVPDRETEAARYMAIYALSNSIAHAVAPLAAPIFLAIGATSAEDKNYSLLFVIAAALTVLGGLLILRVKSIR
ncbi:MFS transporter [Nonomuraea sp. NPDC026600]|uniref:MFS transporter n=1 Tax=Nonomuraea sp. NPDC026600 TaxID=3155363 RepID=UPI00340B136C